MKPKATILSGIPSRGVSAIDNTNITDIVKGLCKEESANFAITANVLNLNEHNPDGDLVDAFVDDVNLSAAGTGNVTSVTNLAKGSRYFRIVNTGAGAKTITHGNNIKIVGAAATAVLAQGEYVKCYNNGTNIYVESIHKFA